jgi:hypothetical protein
VKVCLLAGERSEWGAVGLVEEVKNNFPFIFLPIGEIGNENVI